MSGFINDLETTTSDMAKVGQILAQLQPSTIESPSKIAGWNDSRSDTRMIIHLRCLRLIPSPLVAAKAAVVFWMVVAEATMASSVRASTKTSALVATS